MARGIKRFFTTAATLEPYLGTDSTGADLFGTPVAVLGFLDGKRRQLIRTSDTEQVVASATFYCPLTAAATVPANSRVTIGGVVSRVLSCSPNGGVTGTALPDHLAIALQ